MFLPHLYFEEIVKLLEFSDTFYLVKVDRLGNYSYMNDHFRKKYAAFYAEGDINPAGIALHPDDHAISYSTYLKCLAEPEKNFPVSLRKKDGKGGYIITYWEYKLYRAPNGDADGVVGVGYDITTFESRKEQIKFLVSTLNEVASQQSHQIRRPLANIIGLTELLEQFLPDDDHYKTVVQMLRQSCSDLNDEFELFMIRDLPKSDEP